MLRTSVPLIGALGGSKLVCLMLYIGTDGPLSTRDDPYISVHTLTQEQQITLQWFSKPSVHLVGAHTGCSCGFPSVVADRVIEYFDGMWDNRDERDEDIQSVTALLQILEIAIARGERAELFPVWNGNEARPPKGTIHCSLKDLNPEQFFFNEHYLYVIQR